MKLHFKLFTTPRAMLHPHVVRGVLDFVNLCKFSKIVYGELNRAEYGWLKHILTRIEFMIDNCPDFGGNMQKSLSAYKKLLPQIQKLLQL